MRDGPDHYATALQEATDNTVAQVHATLYVGEQLEVIAGLLAEGGGDGARQRFQELLTAEESGLKVLTEGQRAALRYAIELCEGLSADGREVYRNVPLRQTADALKELI